MLGPLFFVYRGVIVKKFVLQKKNFVTVKKIPKKPFSQNKNLLNMKNVVKQKRCTRSILLGSENVSTIKNQNLRCGIHIKKNTLNHTSETQKSVFFNFVF